MGLKPAGLRDSLRQISTGAVAIPDSAVSQYKVDEGSGNSLNNEFSDQPDATINGPSWVSVSDLVGGYALSSDGTDDTVDIGSLFGFISPSDPFSFAVTVNMADLSAKQVIWINQESDDDHWAVGTDNGSSGRLGAGYYDGSSWAARSMEETLADTGRLRLGVRFDMSTPAVDLFVNGSEATDDIDSNPATTVGTSANRFFATSDGQNYAELTEFDNPIWYDGQLTASEFQEDYDAQPWS